MANCAYFNCVKKTGDGVSLFRFPVKDKDRCQQWVLNSGNADLLDKNSAELASHFICEVHFDRSSIRDWNAKRKLLNWNAVPNKFQDVPVQAASSVFTYLATPLQKCDEIVSPLSSPRSNSPFIDERVVNMPGSSFSPRKMKLRRKIQTLKRRLNRHACKTFRLKMKGSGKFDLKDKVQNELKLRSIYVRVLIMMQLFHKKNQTWTVEQKSLSLSLYYKSPGTYKYIRNTLGFILPSVCTIRSWIRVCNLKPGLNSNLISKLKQKVKTMDVNERQCVVMLDEIKVKKDLTYNSSLDCIEGYEELPAGKVQRVADYALVLYLRGLLYTWKMPYGYYLTSGPIPGRQLALVVKEFLSTIMDIGFNPRSIVCDQGANNRNAFDLLRQELSEEQSSNFIVINSHKIYLIYDSPHLIKSLRNNFMNSKLSIFVHNNLVSWSDIVTTYQLDKQSMSTRALLKITDNHISPNSFQKMRVKYATQIFSNAVAAAIKTAYTVGHLSSGTAMHTAAFVKQINDIFDCLNSKVIKDANPFKSSLSVYSTIADVTLRNAIELFQNIRVVDRSTNKERHNIHCVEGFIFSITSILSLWEDMKAENFKFILTSRLNQDPLENFFSVVRNRGGYNPYPTARDLRIVLQQNIYIRLQTPSDATNCEIDTDEPLFDEPVIPEQDELLDSSNISEEGHKRHSINAVLEILSSDCLPSTSAATISEDNLASKEDTTLESCSNNYVAGYLLYKLFKKHSCAICQFRFLKEENESFSPNNLLIFFRDYGLKDNIEFLKMPSEEFMELFSLLLKTFLKHFQQLKLGYDLKKQLLMRLSEEGKLSKFFTSEEDCWLHYQFVINLFLKIKIYRQLKWEMQSFVSANSKVTKRKISQTKANRKLRILDSN